MDLINILDDVIKNIDYIYDIFGYLLIIIKIWIWIGPYSKDNVEIQILI